MSSQFLKPIKQFFALTYENLKWVVNEIEHQYFLSMLHDIEKKYPEEMKVEVEAFIEHLNAIFYGITEEEEKNCPDFVESPDEDGLNEPPYPYDKE
ncbi:hypothetical protein Pam2_119 [Pseudanabaena phage Pam2]|nr:hypothetical protein Pam2_119 [Pseudanabaena phage Pam2]